MLRPKNCPRCKGHLVLESDHYGWYEQCLQCGYLRDLECKFEARAEAIERDKDRQLAGATSGG